MVNRERENRPATRSPIDGNDECFDCFFNNKIKSIDFRERTAENALFRKNPIIGHFSLDFFIFEIYFCST